jgi:hypothetical protein
VYSTRQASCKETINPNGETDKNNKKLIPLHQGPFLLSCPDNAQISQKPTVHFIITITLFEQVNKAPARNTAI